MAKRDFIISFFAGSPLLTTALSALQTDFIHFQPQVSGRLYKEFVQGAGGSVMGLWNKARRAGDELGRVALLGFSEGCQGVSAVLECPDASTVDVVIPVDGIHRQMTDRFTRALNPVALWNYTAFAKMAAALPPSLHPDGKLMVITHSSIGPASLPPDMASTTETANLIWRESLSPPPSPIETSNCGWPCPAADHVSNLSTIRWPNQSLPIGTKLPGGLITDQGWTTVRPQAPETGMAPEATFSWWRFADGWTQRLVANNLYVFGWSYNTPNKTKDSTGNRDHVFQAQMVLPAVASEMLVRRWNPSCQPGIQGFGDAATICQPGSGKGYSEQPVEPLKNPYPLGVALPVLPQQCPMPPSGDVIVGRPGDPCWTGPGSPFQLGPPSLAKILGVAAGGVAGYYGARYLMKARGRGSR